MNRCPEATGIARGNFVEVYEWLCNVEPMELQTPRALFTPEPGRITEEHADLPAGTPFILCKFPRGLPRIYPCCWGYSENHQGVRIATSIRALVEVFEARM